MASWHSWRMIRLLTLARHWSVARAALPWSSPDHGRAARTTYIYMYARLARAKIFFNAMRALGICFILLPHHDLRHGAMSGRRKFLKILEFLFIELIFEIFRKS